MNIERNIYLDRLIHRMHNGMIKVVTGIRRCGKSYLLFKLFYRYLLDQGGPEKNIIVMELDRWKNREYRNPEVLLDYIDSHMPDDKQYYILLDEVQMLENFEEVLNSLLHYPNADIYVTGSNSKFLSMIYLRNSEEEAMKYMFFHFPLASSCRCIPETSIMVGRITLCMEVFRFVQPCRPKSRRCNIFQSCLKRLI